MLRGDTLFCRGACIEMEDQNLKKYGISLSHLPASSGFICVGSPVSLSSQTAVEVSGVAVRCLPPPPYSLRLNLNILKVNTLKFTHRL